MALDITPSNFWRVPVSPSMWEDLTDIDNWFSALPTYGTLSGLSVSEDAKHVYVEAAVPGVDPKDIDVTFHKGVLWIKGEAKQEETKKKYYRKATSSFSYRVSIPEDIDSNAEPQAVCTNGVMTITFPKSPKTQPKKISVNELGNGKKATVKKR